MSLPNFRQFAINEVLADSNQVVAVVNTDMVVQWLTSSANSYELDAVGRSIADLIHPEDLSRAAQAFDRFSPAHGGDASLMANSTVLVRLITPVGIVPFDVTGRWTQDDEGRWWLVAILHDITTRNAVDQALRKLAAGSDEHDSIQAIITACHEFGGVLGSQIIWKSSDHTVRTFGDLGALTSTAIDVLGVDENLLCHGKTFEMTGSDWGYVLPVQAGIETLGTFAVWGIGPTPDLDFVTAAMSPLLDLAALALTRSREQADLERQATTDLVTGLLNRHAFFTQLDDAPPETAVMYIDLDGFKLVNDEFGHTLGDRLLTVVGRRLGDAVDDTHVVGRIGGDEFAVLCRSVSATQARAVGERIIGALNQTFVIDGHRIATGASIGIAYSDSSIDGRLLLDNADQALLEAKAQGKGRVVVLSSLLL